jgi:hypothetical protein
MGPVRVAWQTTLATVVASRHTQGVDAREPEDNEASGEQSDRVIGAGSAEVRMGPMRVSASVEAERILELAGEHAERERAHTERWVTVMVLVPAVVALVGIGFAALAEDTRGILDGGAAAVVSAAVPIATMALSFFVGRFLFAARTRESQKRPVPPNLRRLGTRLADERRQILERRAESRAESPASSQT